MGIDLVHDEAEKELLAVSVCVWGERKRFNTEKPTVTNVCLGEEIREVQAKATHK